jgi:hypothetical protein
MIRRRLPNASRTIVNPDRRDCRPQQGGVRKNSSRLRNSFLKSDVKPMALQCVTKIEPLGIFLVCIFHSSDCKKSPQGRRG